MDNENFPVSNDLREFAKTGVEHVLRAFETFTGALHKALDNVNATVPEGAKDINVKTISYAEANMKAAFELTQKLIDAKTPQEILQLQTEFLRTQMAAVQEQNNELRNAFQKLTVKK